MENIVYWKLLCNNLAAILIDWNKLKLFFPTIRNVSLRAAIFLMLAHKQYTDTSMRHSIQYLYIEFINNGA
jgi:hypothetical protein